MSRIFFDLAAFVLVIVFPSILPAQLLVPFGTGLPTGAPGTASDAGWSGLMVAEVNGDGRPDITVNGRKGTGARVFRYQGAGTYTESSSGLARTLSGRAEVGVADFNNDGLMDIVEADFGGHFQLPNGTFVAMPNGGWVSYPGEGIAVGDVNGDNRPDVVVTGHTIATLNVLLSDGAGNWIDASIGLPTAPSGIIYGGRKCLFVDLDNDSDLDLVAVLYGGPFVWLNNGNGVWTQASTGIFGPNFYGVAVTDVNNDNWPDLIFSDYAGANGVATSVTVAVYLGNGGVSWTPVANSGIPGGYSASDVDVGDLDSDGIPDIAVGVVYNVTGGTVAQVFAFHGNGNGTFTQIANTGLPTHPFVSTGLFGTTYTSAVEALDIADLNGDGRQDLAYVSYHFGVYAYVQPGGSSVGPGTAGPSLTIPVASTVGGLPYIGNSAFGLKVTSTIVNSPAILALADQPGPAGLAGFPGTPLWVDPLTSLFFSLIPGSTAANGQWTVPTPIPSVQPLVGVRIFAQFAIADQTSIAFSNGLVIAIGQ